MFRLLSRVAAIAAITLALAGCELLDDLSGRSEEVAQRKQEDLAQEVARQAGFQWGLEMGRAQANRSDYRVPPKVDARRVSDRAFAAGYESGRKAGFDSALYSQGERLGAQLIASTWPNPPAWPTGVNVEDGQVSQRDRHALAELVGLPPTDRRLAHEVFLKAIQTGFSRTFYRLLQQHSPGGEGDGAGGGEHP